MGRPPCPFPPYRPPHKDHHLAGEGAEGGCAEAVSLLAEKVLYLIAAGLLELFPGQLHEGFALS